MKTRLNAVAFSLLAALPIASSAAIIQNGSFETANGAWQDDGFRYMKVAQGSGVIANWSVFAAGSGVAWGYDPTTDNFTTPSGDYFVDLSGFGTVAGPLARLEQTLQNLIVGDSYTVGVDYYSDLATLSVNGVSIALTGSAGSGGWTHLSGSFVAGASTALLSVGYTGSSGVAFVDNVTVSGREASGTALPEPTSAALVAGALALLALRRRAARSSQQPRRGGP